MIKFIERWRHVLTTLLAFALVGVFVGVAMRLNFMSPVARSLENFSFADVYFQMQAESENYTENDDIAIVDMTELRERRRIAQLLDEVREQEPKVVGVDILFLGHHADIEGDFNVEAAAAHLSDNGVFSYTLGDYEEGEFHQETHSFFLKDMELTEGFCGFQRDLYDATKRTVSLGRPSRGELRPSFPLVVANRYVGKNIFEVEDRDIHINFTPTRFRVVPWDSIDHYAPILKNRIVLIGAMHNPKDQHVTPIGRISGVNLIAYSIKTLLDRNDLRTVPLWIGILFTFLMVLLSEYIQFGYIRWSGQWENKWANALLSSEVMLTLVTFGWLVLVGYLGILFIGHTGYLLNLGWGISAVAFLGVCRKFLDKIIELRN